MPAPLLVHLIFHPHSAAARALAMDLQKALHDDPALPGLRVPTVIAAEDGTGLPPTNHVLDDAERRVVVVLADDVMVVEPQSLPAGRQTWARFVGDLSDRCQDAHSRFVPVQLSENAWPLDPRLDGTSFLRGQLQKPEHLSGWLCRAVVIEICRFLEGEARGERLPVTLFLSHAKQDLASLPKVFEAINQHLTATQPVKTWIDSAEIEGGSRFAEEIEKGVRDSVLLVLATKSYGLRPWCRKELLLAKREGRPIVILHALEGLEVRSFPYAGNTPTLRWYDGAAAQAVDLMLKETLRHLHVRLLLARQKLHGDVVLTSAPELATLVALPEGSSVLYPDPPVGDEEMEELMPLAHGIETPLQRAAHKRPLVRMPIALSISESGDAERFGMTQEQLTAALYEISRQLLVRGAVLEYGGHLGADGYTVALFDMARAYSALSRLPPAERIVNDVGWPLPLATLAPAARAKHQYVATYRRIPRPDGVEALEPATFLPEPKFFPADSPARRYAWARGMTAMREFQAKSAKARIVLGGKVGPTVTALPDGGRKEQWYSSRLPGVIEEVLVSVRARQPVYLIGAFGGAAALAIDLMEGRSRSDFTWDFHQRAPHAPGMKQLYETHGPAWEDYPAMAKALADTGIQGLAAVNQLTPKENRELFWTRDVQRMVELVLEGLTRL